jgi:hypothetical protein
MRETVKTLAFVAAALALAVLAALVVPERSSPGIFSDQGQAFYPKFTDPQAVRSIEVVDYDEATATARPFQVEFQKGRWILPASSNYPLDVGDRLVKTAAALMDLKKDLARSDAVADHARLGVIDPLDAKVSSLAGRGKRVTFRDVRKEVLADFILGKPVEGKAGLRYVRVPGQKRVYAVKTDADPSARFADWVNAGVLRIAASSLRRVIVNSYSIDERLGRLVNMDTLTLVPESSQWKAMAATLDGLKIVDVKPKPPSLAADLRTGKLQMTLETAMSLRQRGFLLTPNGRLLASEGELTAETANGIAYVLRFGEVAPGGDGRYLLVTVSGGEAARELSARFADWYYVISTADFQKLRLRSKDAVR